MQNTSGVTVDQEDDIDPAKGRHLFLSESRGSGDDIDPPRGRKLYLPAPVEITLVPCHNDMLIMFASPQGPIYLFFYLPNIFYSNYTLIVTFH